MLMFRKTNNYHVVVSPSDQILAVYEESQLPRANEMAANLSELGKIEVITLQRKSPPRIGDQL